MKLHDFIKTKEEELNRQYREVKFDNAADVMLMSNGVAEMFTSGATDLSKEVKEVKLSDLENTKSLPHVDNGSRVVFEVKPPRKRKFTRKEFYVLWV
ncbi:hypothetical protein [Halobacillus litoralis]|uniref:hypothetical protein n=1 Tax=Halobacillus litoralis TaxID=45668 RepID=UPI001CD4DF7E|nr:hypothetical protein [Halobacillus litoralis]MCA1021475.1 hypothetical protein [Halobacillus litoralis]